MITNATIGTKGQLGNQLFQYAFLLGQCARQRRRAFINADRPGFDLSYFHLEDEDLVALVPHRTYTQLYTHEIVASWSERSHLYSSEMAWGADGCDYSGYFQSPYYFDDCANELKKLLRIRRLPSPDVADWEQLIAFSRLPVVSIHIRRGDYLQTPKILINHHTTDYYERALLELRAAFPGGFTSLVFSDDIGWCESSGFLLNYPNLRYVSGLDRIADLYLMSRCHHHVIANSTFSWWGAWMAAHRKQLVVAPRQWFGSAGAREWHTIYPAGWTILESRPASLPSTAHAGGQKPRTD